MRMGSGDRIELLRSLWEGERDVMAYQSTSIVFHLCTFSQAYSPPTVQWVLNHLHAQPVVRADVDEEELQIIEEGMGRWERAGRPRATFEPTEMKKELASGA